MITPCTLKATNRDTYIGFVAILWLEMGLCIDIENGTKQIFTKKDCILYSEKKMESSSSVFL